AIRRPPTSTLFPYTTLSDLTLHEVYLPPFRAAVDAGAQSIMASFNEVAGVPMHAHQALIQDLLRGQWGWDGVLVSDYTGVMELMPHGVAGSREEAGRRACAPAWTSTWSVRSISRTCPPRSRPGACRWP